jgi:hypothetical protein
MEGTLRHVPFIRHVVASGALRDDPLALLDIGCSGGLAGAWREFEPALIAHGIDPMPLEVARLRAAEPNPNVHYHCAFLSLPADHPFVRQRGDRPYWHNNPWDRTSTAWGCRVQAERNPKPTNDDVLRTNRWDLSAGIEKTPTITPAEFLDRVGAVRFDFIKLDVDGPDFEILVGLEDRLAGVLGVCLEVNYFGSHLETDHTFHNVDRFMRRQGYSLAGLTHRPYSRSALPGPFQHAMAAQTTFGPPLQGDALYIRDVVAPENGDLAATLSEGRLLKLACLYALGNLPDCAAEVLLRFRSRLQPRLDVDRALDLLTPPMADGPVPYREYVARFASDMEGWFFPPYQPKAADPEPAHRAAPEPDPAPAPAPAVPLRAAVDIWHAGRQGAKFLLVVSVGVYFAEVARSGRPWAFAVFLLGLVSWIAFRVLPLIPNKRQVLRKLWKVVRTPGRTRAE